MIEGPCSHHWTVTSECPMCLRAQVNALKRTNEEQAMAIDGLRAALISANAQVVAANHARLKALAAAGHPTQGDLL